MHIFWPFLIDSYQFLLCSVVKPNSSLMNAPVIALANTNPNNEPIWKAFFFKYCAYRKFILALLSVGWGLYSKFYIKHSVRLNNSAYSIFKAILMIQYSIHQPFCSLVFLACSSVNVFKFKQNIQFRFSISSLFIHIIDTPANNNQRLMTARARSKLMNFQTILLLCFLSSVISLWIHCAMHPFLVSQRVELRKNILFFHRSSFPLKSMLM